MGEAPRVLVVDDDLTVRNLLVAVLRAEGYEVKADGHADGALRRVKSFRPDLAVLDVRLGAGLDGLMLARQLRERFRGIGVLFLTAADTADDERAGFEAGADFYLTKPFSVDALLVRVDVVLRRSGKAAQLRWQVGDLVVDEGARLVTRAGCRIELSPSEFELLSALSRRPGRVLTKTQILTELRGVDDYNPNLVERHMSSLRRKLEAHGPRLIHTVRSAGYVIRTER